MTYRYAVAIVLFLSLVESGMAQELNKRVDTPPGSKATIGRLMTKSRVQAAEQGQDLSKDTVQTDCQPVQIGNTDGQADGPRSRENAVVIRGNVVNLCR